MGEKGKDKGPTAKGVRAEGADVVATGASVEFSMPPELWNEDGGVSCIRIDGPENTRGKAKGWFASDWGVDFTDVRVSKRWFAPPAPECDECGASATCGIAARWAKGQSFTEKNCASCQASAVAREGIFARCETVEPKTLKEVEPYDGWPVDSALATTPGAVAYWVGEEA